MTIARAENTPIPKEFSCCKASLVGTSPDGSMIKVVPIFCHKWTCPRCARSKADLWRQIATAGKANRFMTLTLRADETKLPIEMARDLKRAFARLVPRIRKAWGEFEYLLIFELTKKRTPHVHILVRSGFIPQVWLSDQWKSLTGAFRVDIRKIRAEADVARYMTKYVGKSIGGATAALHGLRIIQRSKNWILDEGAFKNSKAPLDVTGIESWVYVHSNPHFIIGRAIGWRGLQVDPDSTVRGVVLRGPPDPDAMAAIVWPADLSARSFQQAIKR